MKLRTSILLLSLLSLSTAFAKDLAEGTFHGTTISDKKDVELFVTKYPGREGSFMAIVIKDKAQGFAYLVDKFSDSKYGMTPLKALNSAVIGVENPNPSLTLSIVAEGNKDIIKVLSNNSDNKEGFSDSVKFKFINKTSTSRIVESISGTFKFKTDKTAATLSNQDSSREASLTLNLEGRTGEYVLREVRPSLHLPLKSSLNTVGVEVSDRSNDMAFFLEGNCFFGPGNYLVLMDSKSGTLTYLKQR